MEKTKQFNISKQLFVKAYKHVKANAGSAGVDKQSLTDFEKNLKDNLYKLWNRMSSGSYFPPPVKAVPIPKKTGGERILGVPTVGDRICQMVAKLVFEPTVEIHFLPDSYGYRPYKSALDAIGVTRRRCWHYDWVLEFDIKGLFDNIPHELLMKAVRKHTQEKWIILYIERWLKAPMQHKDGSIVARICGTPQGGVISPVLSNLFLHYVYDAWMQREYPGTLWCRYADDGLAHCKTEQEALILLAALKKRFESCGLELHPVKTKIVYCKDGSRKKDSQNTSFDFLGYTFRARSCKNSKRNSMFVSFTPALSKTALKLMRATTKKYNLRNRADLSLEEIARWFNPILQGWINYYGKYTRSALYSMLRHFNLTLVAWAMRKYRRFRHRKTWAAKFMERISEENPRLFAHWRCGMQGSFA
ncbi:MAG: group II intron reverse transcriptase/maturase [Proteobacteria bacterium]|nr:group II intron reverse transcriptase/maturase [Pseudomonadota bacterium]